MTLLVHPFICYGSISRKYFRLSTSISSACAVLLAIIVHVVILSIGSQPPMNMNTLTFFKWKNEHGQLQEFRLVDRVSNKWKQIGIRLDIDTNILDGWGQKYLLDSGSCWMAVMKDWMDRGGTPAYPATWEGVYLLLNDIQSGGIGDDLKKAVKSAI